MAETSIGEDSPYLQPILIEPANEKFLEPLFRFGLPVRPSVAFERSLTTVPRPNRFFLGGFYQHPLSHTVETVEGLLVVFVLQLVPPTCVACLGQAIFGYDDATIVPAQEACVTAASKAIVILHAHEN